METEQNDRAAQAARLCDLCLARLCALVADCANLRDVVAAASLVLDRALPKSGGESAARITVVTRIPRPEKVERDEAQSEKETDGGCA